MPANLLPAAPTEVMPKILCRAFQIQGTFECLANTYPDGSSDRLTLVINQRFSFKMTSDLDTTTFAALRTFFFAHLGKPFWFYNLRETVPPWSFDPTGADPIGRYTVVFDGQWSDQVGPARGAVNFGLREVA